MNTLTLSRRYAKALLSIGRQDGNLQTYGAELDALAKFLDQYPDILQSLVSPVIPGPNRRHILEAILERGGFSETVKNFLRLLDDKGRFSRLPEMARVYQQLVDEVLGVIRARVSAAVELNAPTRDKIASALERMTGKKISLSVGQDPALIGGLVAQVGNLVLDGSIATQLAKIKDSLKGME